MAGYYDDYDRYYEEEPVGYDPYLLPDFRDSSDWMSTEYDYYDSRPFRDSYYHDEMNSRPPVDLPRSAPPRAPRPREGPQSNGRGRGRLRPEIWMNCDVCDIRLCGMPSWRQHMSGRKHQIALVEREAKKAKPSIQGTKGSLATMVQPKPATSTNPTRPTSGNLLNQSGQRLGASAPRASAVQPLFAKKQSGATSLFEEISSLFRLYKGEPVVGLEFAVLHFFERESAADLECLLCNESVNAKTSARIEHFTGFKHRVTYIRRVGTQEELSLVNKVTDGANGGKAERFQLVKELSIKLEERNGRRVNDMQQRAHLSRESAGKPALQNKPATTTVSSVGMQPKPLMSSGQGNSTQQPIKQEFWEDDTASIGFNRKIGQLSKQSQKEPLMEFNKPQANQSGSTQPHGRRLVPSLMSIRQNSNRSNTASTGGVSAPQPVPLLAGIRRSNDGGGDSDQPPAKKLATTAMLTLSTLAGFLNKDNSELISTDAEAEAALQLSQALSQAVFHYRAKKTRQPLY